MREISHDKYLLQFGNNYKLSLINVTGTCCITNSYCNNCKRFDQIDNFCIKLKVVFHQLLCPFCKNKKIKHVKVVSVKIFATKKIWEKTIQHCGKECHFFSTSSLSPVIDISCRKF